MPFSQTISPADATRLVGLANLEIEPQDLHSFFVDVSSRLQTLETGLPSGPFLSVKDAAFGATGDGATDDSSAIRAALTAAAAANKALYFPPGTYIVSRLSSFSYCLDLPGNVDVFGVRNKSVIKLKAGSPATSVSLLRIDDRDEVTVRDLTFDGNWGNAVGLSNGYAGLNHADQGVGNPSNHGLSIRGSRKITVQNCTFRQCYGDGIWVGMNAAGTVEASDIRIQDCDIDMTGRNGISLAQRCSDIYIGRCKITNTINQAIDFEPINFAQGITGATQWVRNVVIDGCFLGLWWGKEDLGFSVNSPIAFAGGSVSASGPNSWVRHATMRDSTIMGSVIINSAFGVRVQNCRIICDHAGNSYAPILIEGFNDNIWIENNLIYDRTLQEGGSTRHDAAINIHHYSGGSTNSQPGNITVRGNTIYARNTHRGIKVEGAGGGTYGTSNAVPEVNGTATAVGATSMTDSAAAWTVNQWTGFRVRIGAAQGVVVTNSATVLNIYEWTTPNGDAVTTPGTGPYKIFSTRGVVVIDDNTIDCTDDGYGAGGVGIFLYETRGEGRVICSRNKIRNATGEAIRVDGSGIGGRTWRELKIVDNKAWDDQPTPTCTVTVNYATAPVADRHILAGNEAGDGVASAVTGLSTGVWLEADGFPARWAGYGSPEGVVTGRVGATFVRLDGGASTTFYVKTSGTGNTGWTAK